jgi:hypothetical protein
VPLFDPTGRLFFRSDDPAGGNQDYLLRREEQDLKFGVRSINQVRSDRGLEPVPWGAEPWLPLNTAPSSYRRRPDYAPRTGRNRDPDDGDGKNVGRVGPL